MGPRAQLTRILGLRDFRVIELAFQDESPGSRIEVRIIRKALKGRRCPRCHRRCRSIRGRRERCWEDLPWGPHPVRIRYQLLRLRCPRCGLATEAVPFADSYSRATRRLRNQIAIDCQSMPTSHAAVRHAVSWGKARRSERAFLEEWDANRPRHRPRYLGADEIQRSKGQKYWTVLSDLVRGQVIGLAKDRTQESLEGLLNSCLDARQLAAVKACCIDMAKPYRNAIEKVLPLAEVVFDKFHVLQHASKAIDEVRRAEFFRAGEVMRAYGRGKRWLLLKRWDNLDREERGSLKELFSANRRLYKAYLLREQLDRLWTYKTENGVTSFLLRWVRALRWQRLPEMKKLARTLVAHLDGILAYTRHQVRFGVVEGVNSIIKVVLRKARGMRDTQMLLLKLKWVTAHPIRSARTLKRFLDMGLHSDR